MRSGGQAARLIALILVLAVALALPSFRGAPAAAQNDPRYFPESGYRIDNDLIWSFFSDHGGPRALGLPISRTFTLLGLPTQIFQRHVLRVTEENQIQVVSLLDSGWMPYTQVSYTALPPYDPSLTINAPVPDSPRYVDEMLSYLRATLPEQVFGYQTGFFRLYSDTVGELDSSVTDQAVLDAHTLVNLDLWGIPTSRPLRDPNFPNLISMRVERGIFRYDVNCRCSAALPMGGYFRAVLTGSELPADLEQQAPQSPYLRQYDLPSQSGPYRPWALPNTDLTYAFLPSLQAPPLVANSQTSGPALAPTSTPVPRPTQTGGLAVPPPPEPTATPTLVVVVPPTAVPPPPQTAAPSTASGPITRPPYEFTIKPNEAGRETTLMRSTTGEDSRAAWQMNRYERDRNPETSGLGPNIIHNKVYVARSIELARQIYSDEARVRDFPEAVDRYGAGFFLEKPDLGEEVQAFASCLEEGCSAATYSIHIRLVFRNRNVVSVFYTYGDQLSSSLNDVVFLARRVADRMAQ